LSFVTADGRLLIGTNTDAGQALQVNGTFRLADGSQAANKILSSDGTGQASWKTLAEVGGGGSSSLIVGTTTISNSSDGILYDSSGVLSRNNNLRYYPALNSFKAGYNNTASGQYSTAIGFSTISSGSHSFSSGTTTTASGYASFASGSVTVASAVYSGAHGYGLTAKSYGGFSVGMMNDNNDVSNPLAYDINGRAFQIGTGAVPYPGGIRRNAMTTLFNGKTGFGFYALTPNYIVEVIDSTTGVYTSGVTNKHSSGYGLKVNTFATGTEPVFLAQAGINGDADIFKIQADGTVGIGNITNYPAGYKLAVYGNIIAEKVRVKLYSGWPDYVFNDK